MNSRVHSCLLKWKHVLLFYLRFEFKGHLKDKEKKNIFDPPRLSTAM